MCGGGGGGGGATGHFFVLRITRRPCLLSRTSCASAPQSEAFDASTAIHALAALRRAEFAFTCGKGFPIGDKTMRNLNVLCVSYSHTKRNLVLSDWLE